ncbi:MAG: MG2 domain-containing protein, partial [bacterium]|nr:MG2 domain-containing protein [bacterium]
MNLAFKPAGLVIAIFTTSIFSTAIWLTAMQTDDPQTVFEKSRQQLSDGNFRWAADGFRAVVSDAKAPATLVAQSIENAQNCYRSLQSEAEIDALLTVAVSAHPDSPEVLHQAAKTLLQANHYGQVFDQVFYRGLNAQVRVSGTAIRCLEQDRLQALRWLGRAIELSEPESGAELYITLARALLIDRQQGLAWRLQSKTDLALLPDYTNLDQQQNFPSSAAPVDQANAPLLYALPSSFEAAESDGERLHFALHAAQASTTIRPQALMMWASFLDGQFSVATLQPSFWIQRSSELDRDSMFALHTLEESETIAKLASGVQRFPLEEPFNFIAIYRQVLQLDAEESAAAARALVTIFQNRRQYEKAAEIIEMYPSWFASDQLESIRGPRVAFDPMPVQQLPRPELSLVFRNAPRISFRARRVDFEKLLTDTKEFYRNLGSQRSFNSDQPGSSPPDLTAPSQFFTAKQIESYVQQERVEWREEVEPRPRHWDRRIQIQAPIENPGLYLIEATAQLDRDGVSEEHLARTIVWVGSTTLIRTQQAKEVLWRCVDTRSGEPATNTTIEFFGWKFERSAGRARTLTRSFAERTNAAGEVFSNLPSEYSWIAVSRSGASAQPSIAVMGWESFFYRDDRTTEFRQAKAFGVSERPVYRPGDEVKTKFWTAYVAYGDVEAPPLTHEPLLVSVWDPQGKTLAEHQVRTDEFGSFELDFQLPASATLGHYRFTVAKPNPDAERSETTGRRIAPGRSRRPSAVQQAFETSLTFRVEEYRKPEFEVSVLGPSKPVALGETVEARIQAKYFFGSPVTDADVRVVVERSLFAEEYFPPMPFDWCYGPGYWWLGNDYPWYPGWEQWRGCMPPQLGWFPRFPTAPPEVVLDQNLKLDANGEAVVKIDTALAKAVFGDSSDQRYQISVEVRDASRRTITANGEVIAARQPFKLYTWLDRGFYRVGDPVQVNFQSRMLDNTPVVCSGTLELLRISYGADAQPIERAVSSLELNSDDQGQGTQMLTARQAGQYRVRLRMKDANGREVEGGYIFTVRGEGVSGDDFRYSGLELTPEKMHYQPGEKLRLQITADRPNALVALFVRPKEGVYQQPRYVQLTEKSQVVEIDVEEND